MIFNNKKARSVIAGACTLMMLASLTGCGVAPADTATPTEPASVPERGVDGDDWRTQGLINDTITLNTGADGARSVLVCFVGDEGDYSSVDLYEDNEKEELIQSIALPINDLSELDVSVTDLNDDGIDDLAIYGKGSDGNEYTWFYEGTADDLECFVPYEEGDMDFEDPELVNTEFDLSLTDDKLGDKYFDCHGNTFLCDDETAERFPELAAALIEIDEAEKATHQRDIDSFAEEALEAAQEEKTCVYYCYGETALQYQGYVVSMLRCENSFFGGAHPNYWYETINLDTQTGENVLLSDIISDKDKLDTIIAAKLRDEYPEIDFVDLEENLAEIDLDAEPLNQERAAYQFTMDPASLTFYFSPYDLNSYAEGAEEITIFYDEIKDIVIPGSIFEFIQSDGRGDDFAYED
ncbi:MAG: RsiV family protein [Lachnospiraceae bacterium]|nr:RsiV family protein [Lachnospiraceae bacterium]